MKKIFCLFASMLIFFSVSSLAEDVDYSSMSTDGLIEIRRAVEEEIERRLNIDDYVPIPEGYHVVGVDIAPGSYELMYNAGGGNYGVYIFDSQEAKDEYELDNLEYEEEYEEWYELYREDKADSDSEPNFPDPKDYSTISVEVWDDSPQKITVENGQVLLISGEMNYDHLLIRPWTGLFMD